MCIRTKYQVRTYMLRVAGSVAGRWCYLWTAAANHTSELGLVCLMTLGARRHLTGWWRACR